MDWKIKCDFDGTVTDRDTTDFVLENFAAPEWQDVETQWKNGEIDSNECMVKQAALLNATPEDLTALLATVNIDPNFNDFLRVCAHWNVPVQILSDGYDFNIDTILKKNNLQHLEVAANILSYLGSSKFKFTSLHVHGNCKNGYSACKCGKLSSDSREILIGDGRSDFCAAEKADLVIAKDSLLEFCRRKGLPHIAFRDFRDITRILARLFMEDRGRTNIATPIFSQQYKQRILFVAGETE